MNDLRCDYTNIFQLYLLINQIHFFFLFRFLFRFWINLSSIEIFCNDNGTRTFLSISIAEMDSTVKKSLNYITKQLDNCLAEFKLAPFYKVKSTS